MDSTARFDYEFTIAGLYAAILDPTRLDAVNRHLLDVLRSHAGAMHYMDFAQQQARVPSMLGVLPDDVQPHLELLSTENLWMERQRHQLTPGNIGDGDRVASFAELKTTRFYNEFLRHVDIAHSCGITLANDDQRAANFTVSRDHRRGRYQPAELDILARIAPHWVNAFSLAERLEVVKHLMHSQESPALGGRPLLVVNDRLRILGCNHAGEQQLRTGAWLRSVDGRLSTADTERLPRVAAQIVQTATSAEAPEAKLSIGTGLARATLHLHQLPPSTGLARGPFPNVLITLDVPLPDWNVWHSEVLRQRYRLMPAEARLALALHRHQKLKLAASELGISIGNARTTLKQILLKTGQNNQLGLVLLIERLGAGSTSSFAQ